METILSPSPSLPSSFSFVNLQTQPRKNQQLSFSKQRPSRQQIRTQALNNALNTLANSKAPGGDVSVLLPISAVLLFVYWIANFVVPGLIIKDLQPEASDGDDKKEPQADLVKAEKAKLRATIKKSSIKKMFNSKR